MATLSLPRLAVAVGVLTLSLTTGAGVASADPVTDTTCNYGQVIAALNATDPAAAAQLNSSPIAQSYLRQFLASGPDQRQRMQAQVAAMPGASQYINDVNAVAVTCNNY